MTIEDVLQFVRKEEGQDNGSSGSHACSTKRKHRFAPSLSSQKPLESSFFFSRSSIASTRQTIFIAQQRCSGLVPVETKASIPWFSQQVSSKVILFSMARDMAAIVAAASGSRGIGYKNQLVRLKTESYTRCRNEDTMMRTL